MNNLRIIRLFFPVLALLALCEARYFSQGLKIQFQPLERDVIERRLKLVSKDDAERESILATLFREAGCTDKNLAEQPLKHRGVPNLRCALPGTGDGIIIVAGHMDHIPKGKGVVDDWSGAAMLPSLFQSLYGQPRKHTFEFIGFTEEEKGLVGSRYYVKQLAKEDLGKIKAMVNLECLGLGPAEAWGHHASPELLKMYGFAAYKANVPFISANVEQVGDDDTDSFRDRKVQTITIHSLTQETFPILHSPLDDFSAIKWDAYYDSYRLIATYLAYLDQTLD